MVRMALIGCGGMSEVHAARFAAVGSRLKVAATVDTDQERAELVARAVGADIATTDFQEVLPHVDAVLLALPHHLHHPVGMECIAANKHVLMEKPLAISEGECLELIAASERAGVVLMVAYCMRFHPLTVRMKDLIEERTYGDTFHVSIWTEQFTRYEEGSWAHRIATLGGGQFFSHGCHYVDLLLHFLGDPVSGSHIGTNFGTPWMEAEGTSDAMIKFASGAVGYHAGTWGARGTRLDYSFHAHGTEGMLEADFGRGQLIAHQAGQQKVLVHTDRSDKQVELEMVHFLDCVEKGARPITDGPSSLQGLRVIWRMYEAERENRVADLRGLGLTQPWRTWPGNRAGESSDLGEAETPG